MLPVPLKAVCNVEWELGRGFVLVVSTREGALWVWHSLSLLFFGGSQEGRVQIILSSFLGGIGCCDNQQRGKAWAETFVMYPVLHEGLKTPDSRITGRFTGIAWGVDACCLRSLSDIFSKIS